MEIVVSLAAKIAEYSVAPIGRSIGYLIYYHRNMKTLEAEVEKLGDSKTGLQMFVDAAERNGEVIVPEVERWLTTVDGLNEEVMTFLEGEVEINKRGWWCPDPISRYSLSRKAKKKTQAVIELKGKGSFQRVSCPAPPLGIEHMATGAFTDFESRKLTMEEIMAALKDDNINAIGICGLGGVGKTTAVKEVGKMAKVEQLFDEIVMAVVAQKTVDTIQGQLADMLGLKFEEQSISGRASRLRSRLMNCKSVLVILDDVWGSKNLEEVGIPFGGAHKGCKVILTSRDRDACNGMGRCQIFTIGVLSEQEAWSLFKDKAGNSIGSPDLYPTAIEVVMECGALPIAIVTVGTALEDKSKEIWEDALLQLRLCCPENISGMNEKVYLSLELSFNLLQSEEAKSCLLLCCIFEEDADIPLQDLVRFGVGLCLFKRIDGELVQATNRVHTLVDKLKSCYLLLDSVNKECVKMHDVVRDVIRSIATAGKAGLMLRHGLELKEWPTESTDQLYTSTSFMSNEIPHLLQLELKEWPTESTDQLVLFPSCKMRQISSLEKIGDSVKVPENLFEGMKELRVLRLRRMFIPSPPPSLALLTKLQTLCIEDCNLKNISLIGELKTLRILSFCGSSIQELPMETGKLTHLRSLDLTGCSRLKRISPGVLSSLIRLEQLYMRDCGVRWEVEEGISERNNVNVAELKFLSDQLTALEIELPASSAKILGGFKSLVRFYIMIGDTPQQQFGNEHVRRLQNELIIKLDSGIPVGSWINDQLLKKTEILHFHACGVKNVLNSLNRESLVQLKSLKVYDCNELEYVIDTVDLIPQGVFPILGTLDISRGRNLKMICHGQLPAGSFAELRFISLTKCERLENVFSQSIAKGLVQLESLCIWHCEMMEEIVVAEREHEEVSSKIRFPKLRYLSFCELPSLVGFCKKIEFPQLRELELEGLPKLRSLCPSSQGSHESDESATATQHLLNQKVKSFYELRSITVNHCEKLVNVFSLDSIRSLQNLEEIYISNCDSLEVVFDFVGVNIEEGLATSSLGRLKKFELSDLPKLICVWKKLPKRIHKCQKPKSLKIKRCSRLKNIFSPSRTKIVEQLQELDISECETMTEIVGEDEGDEKTTDRIEFLQLRHLSLSKLPNLLGLFNEKVKSLCELRSITVHFCEKLANIFSWDSIQSLQNLEEIYISRCNSVEVALDFVGVNIEEKLATVPLGRLKKFELSYLPKLICVWKKLPKRIHECQKLESLKIVRCSRLKNVFSPSTTKIAEQLQVLEISGCEMMTEIVVEDEGDEKATDKIEFLQLRHLSLSKLPNLLGLFNEKVKSLCELRSIRVDHCEKLANVFSSDSIQSLQNLEEIYIRNCDSLEVALDFVGVNIEEGLATAPLGRLKKFELSDLSKLICVWKKLPKQIQECQKLRLLKIERCSRLKSVFSPSTTKIAVQLQELDISECETMTEIVVEDEGDEKTMDKIEFLQLRHLSLSKLPNLLGLFNEKVKSLCELRSIIVNHCEKLVNVFSSDSIQSLQNLEEIYISNCDSLEVVFDFVGVNIDEGLANASLGRLKKFELSDLPKLVCVWKKLPKRIHKCQKPESLKIKRCSRLKNIFSPSMTKIVEQLQELDISKCETMTEIVGEDEGDEKTTDKIEFLQLRHLSLSKLPNLLGLFNEKVKSLCELRSITVNYCKKLVNVFSLDSIQSLQNLEEIYITNCDSLEVVLDFVGVNIEEGLATAPLGRLKKFELSDLPKLICVWKKLPKRIHECQKLESLKIVRCSRLKNVFSPSTTKISEQLQVLEISECEMMTEIVVEDEGDEKTTDKIEFLQLRHLSLSMLPNLLGLFPKEVGSTEIHLFNEKVSFPRLENLTVSCMKNFGEIWCSEPPSCSFYELRILNVTNCHKILHVAPFHLLKRLQNLEEVRVECCNSVEEVFEFIGPSVEEGHAVMLSRLERMILASLPKLMQICKKDHNRTIGFQNLKHLKVFDCGSLRNLFDPSMTRGLVQLQHLEVIGCEMMEEIVAKGEEQEGRMDKIVIPKLEYLSLYGLQNLTSFCQSLYAFDLPLLDVVRVEYCPNMKTFSFGFASTPKLKEVRIRNREENLMGDLNNTIQQLFQTQTSEPEEDEDEDEDDGEDECNGGSNSEEIDDVEAKNDGASSLKMGDAVARLSDSQGTPMELKVNQETLPQENDAQRDQSPN